jgi:hypothetical protein
METYKRDDDVIIVTLSKEENRKRIATTEYVPLCNGKISSNGINSFDQRALKFQIIEAIKDRREPSREPYTRMITTYIHGCIIFGDFVKAYQNMNPRDRIMNLYNDYKDKSRYPCIHGKQRDDLFIGFINEIKL